MSPGTTAEEAAGDGLVPVTGARRGPGAGGLEAVLFDLGRVLIEWDPFGPYAGRRSRQEVETFFADVDFPVLNHRQDAGRPWAEARAELARTHPHHVAMLDLYVEHFEDAVPHEVTGASAMVEDLLAAGVRVLGLTNWSAETYPVAPRRAPVIARLEAVLVSGQERVAKPDPAVFRLAAERFGIDPARTLFADDAPVNVAAARGCGFVGHVFTDHVALRADLRRRGVRLPPEPPGSET